ncbi:MAG: serine protein kinase [Proteobacteria bacterium]|nr:serine protein kinase [Pseudomonadota bacterium]
MKAQELIAAVKDSGFDKQYAELHWSGTFEEYLNMVIERPAIARNAFQRMYDMIATYGFTTFVEYKKEITHWKFFEDPIENGRDAIFGLDVHLMKLVNTIKAGAAGYGPEKRVILLHGPVGSSKSTIARLMKKGIEEYSKTPEGAMYSYVWTNLAEVLKMEDTMRSPMNQDPLYIIPPERRDTILSLINKGRSRQEVVKLEGDLNPACRYVFTALMKHYKGDWSKIVKNHVRVERLILSERDRIGIGTFQPKDEKNQDSTELTGDINYRKIAEYGSDSDPRAFNFDGEFNIANRGMIEFIEVLKLDVAFLYDLLTASQEHKIKPKKFAQCDIDEVIIGHTNEPEYKKLQNNEFMEALRDRTVKIDVPYITKLKEEVKIYEKSFNATTVPQVHIAPHTLEMAAMWAVLTRLEDPKKANLTLVQKMKLYNGKTSQQYTEDNVKELRKEAIREGLDGISPRYIQDKISSALVLDKGKGCINPFIVLNEMESGLKAHSLINNEELRKRYKELLSEVKREYEDMVKHEVQRAISADDNAIDKLCGNYIDNLKAYIQREKVRNSFTGTHEEPDERLMRSIEEKIDISENRKDDFRREIMNYIGALAIEGKTFDFRANERLHKALELKLFEDQKDTIKLTVHVSKVVDKEAQAKIDIVKSRLIKNYGYCEICSSDVLEFVAGIFARGDVLKDKDRH